MRGVSQTPLALAEIAVSFIEPPLCVEQLRIYKHISTGEFYYVYLEEGGVVFVNEDRERYIKFYIGYPEGIIIRHKPFAGVYQKSDGKPTTYDDFVATQEHVRECVACEAVGFPGRYIKHDEFCLKVGRKRFYLRSSLRR